MYPKSFKKLIENFAALPSVGPKMAERLVLHLFRQDPAKVQDFAENLERIQHLSLCTRCFNIAEDELCEICKDHGRNTKLLCVVEEPLDIISIERTKIYNGLYHVLGGVIYSDEKSTELKIPELLNRVKKDGVKEVIIATNPTTEGDATAFYLKKKMSDLSIRVTRLARGMTTGGDIEYADELTLSAALANRRDV
ncbi:recombination protein RecR [Patescibacteria group bacterium]|nr:MAG: recombination protein RecR [Patescibacteria group bacterium]